MKVEYSRLLVKRSSTPGVIPTIPIDDDINTWISTDLFEGEMFLNLKDDRVFVRTLNGITELLPTKRSGSGVYRIINSTTPSSGAQVVENGFKDIDGLPFVPTINRSSTGLYRLDFTGAVDSNGVQIDIQDLILNVQPTGTNPNQGVVEYSGGPNIMTIRLTDSSGSLTNGTFIITSKGKIM